MRLTKKLIDALRYRPGKAKCVYWDDEIPAFGVRVYPTGKKAFVLFYRVNGRQRFMTADFRSIN